MRGDLPQEQQGLGRLEGNETTRVDRKIGLQGVSQPEKDYKGLKSNALGFFLPGRRPLPRSFEPGRRHEEDHGFSADPTGTEDEVPLQTVFWSLEGCGREGKRLRKCRHRRGCELLIANGDADHGASTVSHDADDDKEDAMMDRTALTELSANEPGYCFFSPEFGSTSPAAYDRDSLTCQDAPSEPAYRKKHRSLEEDSLCEDRQQKLRSDRHREAKNRFRYLGEWKKAKETGKMPSSSGQARPSFFVCAAFEVLREVS